jgi:hypothetical protein
MSKASLREPKAEPFGAMLRAFGAAGLPPPQRLKED